MITTKNKCPAVIRQGGKDDYMTNKHKNIAVLTVIMD